MRTEQVVFILLVLGGLCASYLLSPRKQELALMYLKEGNIQSAEKLYEDIAETGPVKRANLASLKEVYLEQGKIAEAISVYEQYMKRHPNDIEVAKQLAILYKHSHRYYAYMQLLERVAELNPSQEQLEELYEYYITYEFIHEAPAILRQLIAMNPSESGYYQKLIRLQIARKEFEELEGTFISYFENVESVPQIDVELRLRTLLLYKNTTVVLDWIRENRLSYDQLTNLFYVISDLGFDELSMQVAQYLHKRFNKITDIERLAETLLRMDRTSETVALLKPYKNDNAKVATLYEHALIRSWNVNQESNADILRLWQRRLHSEKITDKERRQIAFQLLDSGEKNSAISEFKRLARNEGPDGINVNQLLFIWGPLPGSSAINWIENRAKSARSSELAGWWSHLAQAGAHERIVKIASTLSESIDENAERVLVNSYIALDRKAELKNYLRQRSETDVSESRLETILEYARIAALEETAVHIGLRLVSRFPSNAPANRFLGFNAFSSGELSTAEAYLKQYLQSSESDWESAFYLGEALYAQEKKGEAARYFKNSLSLTNSIHLDNKQIRITRALISFRLKQFDKAIHIYDNLLRDYPSDKQLRANYASLLIETGKLDKARSLLAKQ